MGEKNKALAAKSGAKYVNDMCRDFDDRLRLATYLRVSSILIETVAYDSVFADIRCPVPELIQLSARADALADEIEE